MSDWTDVEVFLARSVLRLADLGGMPDTYWQTDTAVQLARHVLNVGDDERYTKPHIWERVEPYE